MGFVVVVALIGAIWIYHEASQARSSLLSAKTKVATLRANLLQGNISSSPLDIAEIREESDSARHVTSGPLWSVAAHLPFVGTDVSNVRVLADTVDGVARDQLSGLADAATAVSPQHLRRPDGSFDLGALQSARTSVGDSLTAVSGAAQRVAKLSRPNVGSIANAQAQLLSQLIKLRGDLTGAQHALDVLVPMLAPGGDRTYLLAFQNPAQDDGTGGLIGTYGVLHVANGKATLAQTGTDAELAGGGTGEKLTPVSLSAGYLATWGFLRPTTTWQFANASPDFPTAGKIMAAKYLAQYGIPIDGVISLDPYVLGALVGPSGDLRLPDGTVVTGADLPDYMLNTLYIKYVNAYQARKIMLTKLVSDVFAEFQSGPLDGSALARIENVARTGHVQVWSAHADEETSIRKTEVSGAVPDTAGPFAFMSTVNFPRNKADFFLDRSLSYQAAACPTTGTTRSSTITVTLTSATPPAQPMIIDGRYDLPSVPPGIPAHQSAEYLSVFAASGARLISATLAGKPVSMTVGSEAGHPVFSTDVELPRGVPQTLVLHLVEPAEGRVGLWRPVPLPRAQKTDVNVPICS